MSRLSHGLGLVFALAAIVFGGCTTGTDPSADATATASGLKRDMDAPSVGLAPTARPVAAAARSGQAKDAYVLLSGGGTPLSNNYSQYLQARAVAGFFERECPADSTWIFFGVGNREGAAPVLADARRDLKHDGRLEPSWLPGTLPRNRPATREVFLRALREEILPRVRDGGTLYLFVGDHGELAGSGDRRESAITLWQLKRASRRAGGWITDEKEILGVAELRQVIAEGLGQGRVVFGMTQCHGGGFHELGIAPEMVPPREWFSSAPPAWAAGRAPGLLLPVAGYTATDQASPAAGCEADPDPDRWAGYERFLPEALLGIDLMTGQPKGAGARSFAEAHDAATLVDRTIDKPRATSEAYLEAWARLIETRLATAPRLTARVQRAVEAYAHAVDVGEIHAGDAELGKRREQFAHFTARLAEQQPAAKELLLQGTRQQLEGAIRGRGERGGPRGPRRAPMAELRRAWSDVLRPAWKSAVLAGRVPGLTGGALTFEKRLLKLEDGGRDFLLPRGGDDSPLVNELYWTSGYAEPATLDRPKAEAMARWGAERRERIIAWGKDSSEPLVRAAAEKIGPGPAPATEQPRPLSRRTAAERVLFYRRVLAAWEFLVTLQAHDALAELSTLIALEQTPVRRVP